MVEPHSSNFRVITTNILGVQIFRKITVCFSHELAQLPAPITQLVEYPLRGIGGDGFNPGPRLTKVVKNGISCSSLGTQIYGVELGLAHPVSG